jgi:thiol-disulfide isomerase/thioredoxin
MLVFKAADFAGTRLLDSRSILAVFYADWCPFCRSFLMPFEKTMKEKTDPLGALIDISDTNNPLWETFQVEIVPTLVGFKNGEALVRKNGVAGVGLDMPELLDALRTMEEP